MKKSILIIFSFLILNSIFTEKVEAFSFFKKDKNQTQEQYQQPQQPQDYGEVELDVSEQDKLKIEKNEPVKEIKAVEMSKSDEEKLKAFQIQRKQDIEDITNLWQATVERNNVIKFALRKVTMNPEERKKHSSKMARTISALLNGAMLLPYAFGLDASIASAIAAGSSLSTQAAKNKLGYGPANIPVTDTELIQLASLIEDLQNNLIKNYYLYKSAIELLKDCRSKLAVYKKNHRQAVAQNDQANILVTKSMCEKQQLEELKLVNQIKMERIELERFAGAEVVDNLNLVKVQELQVSNSVYEGGV